MVPLHSLLSLSESAVSCAVSAVIVDTHRPLGLAASIAVSICAPTSLLYFDHVFRMTDMGADTYVALTARLFGDPAELCREISAQIWTTSKVAAAKYTWVHRSMIGLFSALIAVGTAALAIGIG